MEAFGRKMAKARLERGWTQQDLADRVGVSRVALSHIEAGMTWPNERTVTLLAGWFKVEPTELVAGTDYPAAKAERVPLVANRHTEVDLQLALLARDLAWAEGAGARANADTRAGWRAALLELLDTVADPGERSRLQAALRSLA
jgi:transcriptional regulator with XRE-family HTH domain